MSGIPIPPHEIIISLKIIGEVVGIWAAGKFLDYFWEKIKSIVKKTKEKTGITPFISIEGNRALMINFNFENPKNLDEALKKLPGYLTSHPKTGGWQWYNEELKEWGDINRVMEWKQNKN